MYAIFVQKLQKMTAILTDKIKLQVELSFDEVLGFVEKFTPEQKQLLLQRLRMGAFREKWAQLAKKIKSPKFSEQEIQDEVKSYRKERLANA
ncbi:MAG: hypothetical protein ACKVUS_02095 [Saprospiraceae bacterium]